MGGGIQYSKFQQIGCEICHIMYNTKQMGGESINFPQLACQMSSCCMWQKRSCVKRLLNILNRLPAKSNIEQVRSEFKSCIYGITSAGCTAYPLLYIAIRGLVKIQHFLRKFWWMRSSLHAHRNAGGGGGYTRLLHAQIVDGSTKLLDTKYTWTGVCLVLYGPLGPTLCASHTIHAMTNVLCFNCKAQNCTCCMTKVQHG